MFEKVVDVEVLREKFILHRLRQVSRFGRYDIESFLEEQAEADLPDCEHHDQDSDCFWCWLTDSEVFHLPETISVLDLFKTTLTPVCVKTCQLRLCDFNPYRALLENAESAKFYVGRDRFIVMVGQDKTSVFEVRENLEHPNKTEFLCRPLGGEFGYTSLAIADLLMAEWMRKTGRSALARSILVSSIQIQVCQERGRAGDDFDASVAVSDDGSKIIKASWIVVYDPKTKMMMFHRPDWFAANKMKIGEYKRRALPEKRLTAPNAKDIDSFTEIATFVRNELIGKIPDGGQVVIPLGRKSEPILFISGNHLQKAVPVGVCQVQLP